MYDGEFLDVQERLVPSPATGVFAAAALPSVHLAEGDVIGHVTGSGEPVPVTAPFGGVLVEVTAVAGERVRRHDRIAWMRAA